jgi:hypothetical protein
VLNDIAARFLYISYDSIAQQQYSASVVGGQSLRTVHIAQHSAGTVSDAFMHCMSFKIKHECCWKRHVSFFGNNLELLPLRVCCSFAMQTIAEDAEILLVVCCL